MLCDCVSIEEVIITGIGGLILYAETVHKGTAVMWERCIMLLQSEPSELGGFLIG